MLRLQAAIKGDLRKIMREEYSALNKASARAIRENTRGLLRDVKAHTRQEGLKGLARAWHSRFFRGKKPLDAAGIVFARGRGARAAIFAFEHGATIRPQKGRYLLIPTRYNRRNGHKNGRVIYKPDQLQGAFVKRTKDGNLVLFAPVRRAQTKKKGVVRNQAYVESHLLGSGRIRRTERILNQGIVPMFVLKPQIRLTKRLNLARLANKWADRLQGDLVKYWGQYYGGK